jgi:hypothetical protein
MVRYSDSPTGAVVGSTTILVDAMGTAAAGPAVATLVRHKKER